MGAQHFEFCGPHGPIGIVIGLPLVCYGLVYSCNSGGCLSFKDRNLPGFPAGTKLISFEGFSVFLGWMSLVLLLHLVLPGKKLQGSVLANKTKLTYKLNGLYVFAAIIPAAMYFSFGTGQLNLAWVYDNYVALLTAAMVFCFLMSTLLYASSFGRGKALAQGGNTGYPIYDFFLGRELNPRIGSIDLKEFCELYPGLIGWVLLDLGMAHKQYLELGHVTNSMVLVCAFHMLYVVDGLWNETAILTTMDITTDGFGFMLAFGDLTWVPFIYCMQARYLVDNPKVLSGLAVGGILALKALGYLIFRGANSQKDQFRRDPEHPAVRRLKTIQTASGRKLMVSGWWGIARHINYFGDWLMGWAWCLPCGFNHIIPYFYVIYFGTLLVHRDRRDEHSCRLKYGKDWDVYCAKVKYRIVPLIY